MGGGVVEEQCVCLYVKLCIKAAPLIIYSWIYSVALGKASSVILNMALRQLISYNQIFFLAAQCFHKVFLTGKKRMVQAHY